MALYVEEHEPSLQAAILSAVDLGAVSPEGHATDVPPVIIEKLVSQAVERARTIGGGKSVGRRALQPARDRARVDGRGHRAAPGRSVRSSCARARRRCCVLAKSPEAASPYAITVKPGDVTIPKGSDQSVSAKLAGFRSSEVALMVKGEGDAKFERMPLVTAGDAMTFEGMLFDVKKAIEYYVEADGVKSPTYSMKVVELPAVAKLELEYVFPSYTGMPPQKVEDGGDVAAISGTQIRVKITSTIPTPGGRLQARSGRHRRARRAG